MARSKKKSGDGGGRTKATKAKKAEVRNVDAEGVEEVKGGLTFEDGIVLTTSVVLLVSIVLVAMASGRYPA